MQQISTVVIFFNDWKVYPGGINAGGGEAATMALARAIARRGKRVIVCANLPDGECSRNNIEFWNFGSAYVLHEIEKRLRDIGPYCCIAATLVHPFLLLREHTNCQAKIIMNHSPSAYASGLEPQTVMEIVDSVVCVSLAQRSMLLTRGNSPEKLVIIKNGFDPEIFTYAGPEGRDWNQLIFIGRLEAPKGIHIAVAALSKLKDRFPNLKLAAYGDTNSWPEFAQRIPALQQSIPGFVYHGKVPQQQLATELRHAGILVFPSISFETAGLSIIDAQASGCPVVAFGIGGVPEYLIDKKCGELTYGNTENDLADSLSKLLSNIPLLEQMSRNCETLGRVQTWDKSAEELLALAEAIISKKSYAIELKAMTSMPVSCQRTISWRENTVERLVDDHEIISSGGAISIDEIEHYCQILSNYSAPYLWRGLWLERQGQRDEALNSYHQAFSRSDPIDWQALFRLTMLQVESGKPAAARQSAEEILRRLPMFPFANQLKAIVEKCKESGF